MEVHTGQVLHSSPILSPLYFLVRQPVKSCLNFSEISAQVTVMIAFRAMYNLFSYSEDVTKIKFMQLN